MERGIVENAILALSGRCDGARTRDGVGWNKFDTQFGKAMADRIQEGKPLTIKMRGAIKMILPKYRGQFANWEDVKKVLPEWANTDPYADKPAPSVGGRPDYPQLGFDGLYFTIATTKGNPEHYELARTLIPHGHWEAERKVWIYSQMNDVVLAIKDNGVKFRSVTREALTKFSELLVNIQKESQPPEELPGPPKGLVEDALAPVKIPMYQHQKKAFLIGINFPNAALLMEPGTGKTLSAEAVVGYRHLHNDVTRLLVVINKTGMGEWQRQFKEHADFKYRIRVLREGVADKKRRLASFKEKDDSLLIVVVNYDSARVMVDELMAWHPQMVICDESQKLKHHTSQQSQAMWLIGQEAQFRLILTGTPVTHSPLDAFGQYRFLDSSIFGTSWPKFRGRYAVTIGQLKAEMKELGIVGNRFAIRKWLQSYPWEEKIREDQKIYRWVTGNLGGHLNQIIVAYKNLDELTSKIYSVAYRVTQDECPDLPKIIPQYLYVTLEPKARAIYRKMEKEALVEIDKSKATAPIILTKMLRLSQITGGFLPGISDDGKEQMVHAVSKAKLEGLEELIEGLQETNEKAVIFCRFIPELHAISNMLRGHKISHEVLYGDTKNRDEVIAKFQAQEEIRFIVVQIATGGLSVTLTAAPVEIFYSIDHLENYTQATFRIKRYGQKVKHVRAIHILVENTIDIVQMEGLKAGKDLSEIVMKDPRSIIMKEG